MLKRVIYLIPLLAGLAVAAMAVFAFRADRDNHLQKTRIQVSHRLNDLKTGLERAVHKKYHLISVLQSSIKADPNFSPEEFHALAHGLLEKAGTVRTLLLAKDNLISHAHPGPDVGKILGQSVLETGQTAARIMAIQAMETGLTRIVMPKWEDRGTGDIVILAPVTINGADDKPVYWGLISLTMSAAEFFREAGLTRDIPGIMYALRTTDAARDRSHMLIGDQLVFDMRPIVMNISAFSFTWQLAAAPVGGWGASPYRNHIVIGGTLAVLLIPASLWAVISMFMARYEEREKYRQLVQNAKSIILRIDMAGDIVFCNEYAEQFYGYDPGELTGQPLIGTLMPLKNLEGESTKRYLSRMLKNPSAHPFNESMNLRKNGEIVWVAWANDSILARDGTMVGLLCVGTDITDRKLMEEALRQREKQYRLLAENVTDVIWGLDADLHYTFVSPSDEIMRGFKRYDVIGRPMEEFLTPASRTRFQEAIATLMGSIESEGQLPSVTEDMEFVCADGNTIWLESQLGVLLNDEGEKIGIQGVSRDISDRKLAEALREDVERMARHDLKTPLGAVIGLPAEIRRLGKLTPPQEAMLDTVEDAGQAMLTLINRSLDLYKMECGTYLLEKKPVDILPMLDRIKTEARSQIRDKGVSIGIDTRGSEFETEFQAVVEPDLFQSMLSNLVVNGIEASPEGGSVSVLLERNGGAVAVTIRNQGEVPEVVRETFFDKYSTAAKPGGTGLGTYSAKLIARTHGGDVHLDTSAPGETIVKVTLPA